MGWAYLFFVFSLCATVRSTAFGATIFSSTHVWTDTRFGEGWQVAVDLNIFDNFQGDYSQLDWRYTVHNISYDPPSVYNAPYYTQTTSGLSGFYVAFDLRGMHAGLDLSHLNIYSSRSWRLEFMPGNDFTDNRYETGPGSGVGWKGGGCAFIFPGSPPLCGGGLPIGSSADFGFTTPLPLSMVEGYAAVFTWIENPMLLPFPVAAYELRGPVEVFGVSQVPESNTPVLMAVGLAALLITRRYITFTI
jgi:hypothetical protein